MNTAPPDKKIRTNDLPVAQALATPYQRELLARFAEHELGEITDYTFDGHEGPLELTIGDRRLTLPAAGPDDLEALLELQRNPYARMWARLYSEILDEADAGGDRHFLEAADRIAGEVLGDLRPADGQEVLPTEESSYAPGSTCAECGLPGGYHGDSCQSPAARTARGLEPIRPAPQGRRR